MKNNAMSEQEIKAQHIRDLKSILGSGESDIGDWKIIKCSEAKLAGEPMPYDLDELLAKRAEVRKKINELEKELEA